MTRWSRVVRRGITQLGRFVWDFFVGDTPELFAGTLIVLGVVALVSDVAHDNAAGWVVLPLLVLATLWVSTVRALRSSKRR